MQTVRIQATDRAVVPSYATAGSAGADLSACLDEGQTVVIPPGGRAMIPTGLRMQIPVGFEVQVRPRSGLAAKQGITVLNTPGTIDSDYRGEVKVILINHSHDPYTVHHGDRIAQMVIAPVIQCDFLITEDLEDSTRGSGGFGSTGR